MNMQKQEFTERDWKIFRRKIIQWQAAFMDKLNNEYIELLNGGESPAEKFWTLHRRINDDQYKAGVQVMMSRSDLIRNICTLIYEDAISLEDLEEFSDELKETVQWQMKAYN